jgi:hypothetical protein
MEETLCIAHHSAAPSACSAPILRKLRYAVSHSRGRLPASSRITVARKRRCASRVPGPAAQVLEWMAVRHDTPRLVTGGVVDPSALEGVVPW